MGGVVQDAVGCVGKQFWGEQGILLHLYPMFCGQGLYKYPPFCVSRKPGGFFFCYDLHNGVRTHTAFCSLKILVVLVQTPEDVRTNVFLILSPLPPPNARINQQKVLSKMYRSFRVSVGVIVNKNRNLKNSLFSKTSFTFSS